MLEDFMIAPFLKPQIGVYPKTQCHFLSSKKDQTRPSSTTNTAMTPAKLDQPMPTSIKGQALVQGCKSRGIDGPGKTQRGFREESMVFT